MPVPSRREGIVSVDSDDESEKSDDTDGENDLLDSELKKIHELESKPLEDGDEDDSDY